jgi:hypothetical protein
MATSILVGFVNSLRSFQDVFVAAGKWLRLWADCFVGQCAETAKSYAVGLEISCPGGAYYWAPEIPSTKGIAVTMTGKCELVHKCG